ALEATWYLLGRHPEADARLHEELVSVVGDRLPDPVDRARLPYLEAVLRETLRLFPPARHIDRCPAHDVRIGDTLVGSDAHVVASQVVTHHDPGLHERSGEFIPERWLGDDARRGSRGASLPFGAGPHSCIGEPLAWAIMTAALATIALRWRLRVDP